VSLEYVHDSLAEVVLSGLVVIHALQSEHILGEVLSNL